MRSKKIIFNVYVVNQAGVLMRITQVFSRRGFNIDSLAVSAARDSKFSHMTITAFGEESKIEQIVKQVHKLVDVVHCESACSLSLIKEIAFIKIEYLADNYRLKKVLGLYKGSRISFSNNDILIIEFSGTSEEIDSLIRDLKDIRVIEVQRSGCIAIKKLKDVF